MVSYLIYIVVIVCFSQNIDYKNKTDLITVTVADVCVIFKIKISIMFILYTSCVFDI